MPVRPRRRHRARRNLQAELCLGGVGPPRAGWTAEALSDYWLRWRPTLLARGFSDFEAIAAITAAKMHDDGLTPIDD